MLEKDVGKKINIESFFAFLLGLSVFEGISVIFKVGSTQFTASEVLAPIVLVCILFRKKVDIGTFVKKIPIGFKLFFFIIIFSIIPGILNFGFGAIYRYVVGLIYFLIILTVSVDVYLLKDYKDSLIKGLAFGVALNVLFSLVCYVVMGWLIIFRMKPLMHTVAPGGIVFLVLGGIVYTLGIIFFAMPKLRYMHSVWHFFVLGGSILHFFSLYWAI